MKHENKSQIPNLSQPVGQDPTSEVPEKTPKEQSILGLAAELKNLLRGDEVYRSEQAHRLDARDEKTEK